MLEPAKSHCPADHNGSRRAGGSVAESVRYRFLRTPTAGMVGGTANRKTAVAKLGTSRNDPEFGDGIRSQRLVQHSHTLSFRIVAVSLRLLHATRRWKIDT